MSKYKTFEIRHNKVVIGKVYVDEKVIINTNMVLALEGEVKVNQVTKKAEVRDLHYKYYNKQDIIDKNKNFKK